MRVRATMAFQSSHLQRKLGLEICVLVHGGRRGRRRHGVFREGRGIHVLCIMCVCVCAWVRVSKYLYTSRTQHIHTHTTHAHTSTQTCTHTRTHPHVFSGPFLRISWRAQGCHGTPSWTETRTTKVTTTSSSSTTTFAGCLATRSSPVPRW